MKKALSSVVNTSLLTGLHFINLIMVQCCVVSNVSNLHLLISNGRYYVIGHSNFLVMQKSLLFKGSMINNLRSDKTKICCDR